MKSSRLDGHSDSNTEGFLCGSTKAGDTCTRVGSLESRIEPPNLKDSLGQSNSIGFKNALPLTKSFLRTLAAPSNNFETTDEESPKVFTTHQEYKGTDLFGRKLSSSDESCPQDQKERPRLGDVSKHRFSRNRIRLFFHLLSNALSNSDKLKFLFSFHYAIYFNVILFLSTELIHSTPFKRTYQEAIRPFERLCVFH